MRFDGGLLSDNAVFWLIVQLSSVKISNYQFSGQIAQKSSNYSIGVTIN